MSIIDTIVFYLVFFLTNQASCTEKFSVLCKEIIIVLSHKVLFLDDNRFLCSERHRQSKLYI